MESDYTSNNVGMKFKYIKPGSFMMGSPEDEIGRSEYEQQHRVVLTKKFYMQVETVSVGQWRQFAKESGYKTEVERGGWTYGHVKAGWHIIVKGIIPFIVPKFEWQKRKDYFWDNPGFSQTDNHPVTCISWNDVQFFINWMNQKDGLTYRLPTEAEWEYACRAGSRTSFFFGPLISKRMVNANIAKYSTIRFLLKKTRTVTSDNYSPNAWGLYHTHGNVWEWCQDSCDWDPDSQSIISNTYVNDIEDPVQTEGQYRILRGGSWVYPASYCRSAHRRALLSDIKASGIGFRLVHD